jgi:hypothetical protein
VVRFWILGYDLLRSQRSDGGSCVGLRALRRSEHRFISNLTFGPEHQIARETAPPRAVSRLCADFISDLKFGSERQIQ